MKNTLSKRFWTSLIIFSFVGQVAWVVENMYLNVFIFQEFNASPNDIALMVSLSAITATLTTLFMGALSDKIGKRKLFICVGYILWGISIISFALLKKDILSNLFPYVNSATLGITLVILFDCMMTLFGSTANDASFNAWLTDVTTSVNRGKVEDVNSVMPLVALLAVFGGFMGLTADRKWSLIFIVIGLIVLICGILGFFLIKDAPLKVRRDSYFKNILYGFRLNVIKTNKTLYVLLLGFSIFGIAMQVFMPYLILYFQYRLKLDNYVMIFAPAIILASIVTLFYGRLLDKYKFKKSIITPIISFIIGLLFLYLYENTYLVFIGTLLMMTGNLTITASFGAIIRDYTPKDKMGLFQGLRIFAYVLIPMIIGPWIGSNVIYSSAEIVFR
jgi:MFS family permease